MYNIGEVAKMLNISISTLRYYDKEGLLLDLKRDKSGIRKFSVKNIQALKVIECLKKSGLQIKEIKEFMYWCSLGDQTIINRKNMFFKQRENVIKQIKELESTLNMLNYKCWYYTKALEDGTEKRVKNITLNDIPDEIKKYYIEAHK